MQNDGCVMIQFIFTSTVIRIQIRLFDPLTRSFVVRLIWQILVSIVTIIYRDLQRYSWSWVSLPSIHYIRCYISNRLHSQVTILLTSMESSYTPAFRAIYGDVILVIPLTIVNCIVIYSLPNIHVYYLSSFPLWTYGLSLMKLKEGLTFS